MQEIERKFLVKQLPDLSNQNPIVYERYFSKITNFEEKEKFKQNYLADTIIASEVRLLTWIYKELFSKEYKIK